MNAAQLSSRDDENGEDRESSVSWQLLIHCIYSWNKAHVYTKQRKVIWPTVYLAWRRDIWCWMHRSSLPTKRNLNRSRILQRSARRSDSFRSFRSGCLTCPHKQRDRNWETILNGLGLYNEAYSVPKESKGWTRRAGVEVMLPVNIGSSLRAKDATRFSFFFSLQDSIDGTVAYCLLPLENDQSGDGLSTETCCGADGFQSNGSISHFVQTCFYSTTRSLLYQNFCGVTREAAWSGWSIRRLAERLPTSA